MLRASRVAARTARRAAPSRGMSSAPAMVTLTVDGKSVSVPPGFTILQAAEQAGVDVPRFCFHERLSVAGNCRMCLVELEKAPKPAAACAMPVMPGMVVKTNSPLVKKAREGVVEFLLANHPLDCPVCCEGGECDLQDQVMAHGSDRSRFKEIKRAVEDKELGPFIKTAMTRCIHCTRCVRFAEEIAGVDTLGVTGRGSSAEIGTYVSQVFDTELSGNVADICPVGALIMKPSLFTLRSWELDTTESVDVMDAVGSSVRVDTRGAEIMRVLPRLHEDVNEEWIADKTRFAYDGLKRQRLDVPLVRRGGELVAVTWQEAFGAVREALQRVRPDQIKAVAGDHAEAEAVVALKDLVNRLGSVNTECRQDGAATPADLRSYYTSPNGIARVEEADELLLVGTNPRMEAPMLNARVRKAWLHHGLRVSSVGPAADLTYPVQQLGESSAVLRALADGSHPHAAALRAAERPMVVVGQGALRGPEGGAVLEALEALAAAVPGLQAAGDDWQGINVLQLAAGRAGALDLGFVPGPGASDADLRFVYLLNADDLAAPVPDSAFVVYQGHHGDAGASRADVILPGLAYTEKSATYVNTEGRVQRTNPATGSVGDAREDWAILRALSETLGAPLPYDTADQVRARLADVSPTFAARDRVQSPGFAGFSGELKELSGGGAKLGDFDFVPAVDNYFMTCPVSRASRNMARATAELPNSGNSYAAVAEARRKAQARASVQAGAQQ